MGTTSVPRACIPVLAIPIMKAQRTASIHRQHEGGRDEDEADDQRQDAAHALPYHRRPWPQGRRRPQRAPRPPPRRAPPAARAATSWIESLVT